MSETGKTTPQLSCCVLCVWAAGIGNNFYMILVEVTAPNKKNRLPAELHVEWLEVKK